MHHVVADADRSVVATSEALRRDLPLHDPARKGWIQLLDEAGWKDNGAGKARTKGGEALELRITTTAGNAGTRPWGLIPR